MHGIFVLRKRLPLYADDRSRIFEAYALSLLRLSVSQYLPSPFRLKLWNQYAAHFTMPISVSRFCEAVGATPRLESDLTRWASVTTAGVFLRRFVEYQNTKACFREMEREERAHMEQFAILLSSGEPLTPASVDLLESVSRLIILFGHSHQKQDVDASLPKVNEGSQSREFVCLSEIYTGPYSEGQKRASDKADAFAATLVGVLMADERLQSTFHNEIKSDIALLLSDLCYHTVQNIEALQCAISDLEPGVSIILSPDNSDCAPALYQLGFSVCVGGKIYDPAGLGLQYEEIDTGRKSVNILDEAKWHKRLSKIDARLLQSLGGTEVSHGGHAVYVLCNRRAASYDNAVARIEANLGYKYDLKILNSGAPKAGSDIVFRGDEYSLYTALRSWSFSGKEAAHEFCIESFVDQAFLRLGDVSPLSTGALKNRLQGVVENNFATLLAHGRLFQVFTTFLKTQKGVATAQAILLPGRDPTVRVLARALKCLSIPVTDVQVLFVSDMPRYKSPIADKLAVIDSHARAHFCEKYNYKPSDVHLMGAINLDAEVELAKACDIDDVYTSYFDAPKQPVVTYALQPLSAENMLNALSWCAKAVKTMENFQLLVKLHPSQSDDVLSLCERVLSEKVGKASHQRWAVVQHAPFHEIISISDVLLTHYSNVALTAALLGKPVGALPVSGAVLRPKPTLSDMGLATDITSVSELVLFIEKNAVNSQETTSLYLEQNPQMANQKSLQVLEHLLDSHHIPS